MFDVLGVSEDLDLLIKMSTDRKQCHAKSFRYKNKMNSITWDHVIVEDYNNHRFKIRFDDGLTKNVDRLSLIFATEDPIQFIERVEIAR